MLIPMANSHQPGGEHYKMFGVLQPWDVIIRFKLPYLVGNSVKYLLRYQYKSDDKAAQILDLEKARHYIDKQLEVLREEIASDGSTFEGRPGAL